MSAKPSVAWSFSALNTYETCPKKYWHLKIAKDYKEDFSGPHAEYGKAVHKAFELRVKKNKPLPMDMRHFEKYVAKFAEAPGKKLVELQLAINEAMEPTGWFDKDVWCRAILDLAITNGNKALVVDYKTGKMKDDFSQLRLASALFLLHAPEIEHVTMAFFWTKDKAITKEVSTRDECLQVFSSFVPRVARLNRSVELTEWPARPNGLCRKYCPIQSCPHHGR